MNLNRLLELSGLSTEILTEGAAFPSAVLFDDWSAFIAACNALPQNCTIEQACESESIPFNAVYVKNIVELCIANWRDSTSTSIIHGIANIHMGTVPPQGTPIFTDMLWQTRFLMMCRKNKIVSILDTDRVIDPTTKQVVTIRNEDALTSKREPKINRIIRAIYLYWFLNTRKSDVKLLAKALYRGVRAGDLIGHENFKPIADEIYKNDKSRYIRRKQVIDALVKYLCDNKLHTITDGNMLAFSATIPVAKYFSKGSGLILKVDPRKVEIITSEVHDPENLAGPEPFSGRVEREYICRIPADYQFQPSDIMINDLDYLIASVNPLCVAHLDHDDTRALYTLNGADIEAQYVWLTDSSGGLRFYADLNGQFISGPRSVVKKNIGFDPMPTEANLKDISNFRLETRPYTFGKWSPLDVKK
jgi:hypothetical protein